MKKLLSYLLALLMLLSLTACGESAEPDPNCGLYEARSASMSGLSINLDTVFEDGFSIELKAGGRASFHYEGKSYGMKWTLDGTAFEAKGGGAELEGTLSDGVMVLENVLDSGITLTLVNADYDGPAESSRRARRDSGDEPAASDAPAAASATADWWAGRWYGWRVIYIGYGSYEALEDKAWDVVADFELDGDTGLLTIWDYDDSKDDPLLTAEVQLLPGSTENGCVICENGVFDGSPLESRAFVIDPGKEDTSVLEHMISFFVMYQDPDQEEDRAELCFVMRPWGMDWEDVRTADTTDMIYDDMMPIAYEDWYLPQLGQTAPAATGGELDPAAKEGADGQVSLETLQRVLPWAKSETSYSTTYEECAAQFGVHGKAVESAFEGVNIYRWECGDAYIQLSFNVHDDGSETWNVTQYNGID